MHTWNEALMIGMGDGLKKIAASKKSGTIHVPSANVPGPGENLGKLMAQIKAKSKPTEVKLPGVEKKGGLEILIEKGGKTATASVKPPPKKVEVPKQMSPALPRKPSGWQKPGAARLAEEGKLSQASFEEAFIDELDKIAAKKRKMPHFTEQDRPEGAKRIYRALKRGGKPEEMRKRYGKNWKEVAARIAARQGKKGKQKQGPPYKGPLGG